MHLDFVRCHVSDSFVEVPGAGFVGWQIQVFLFELGVHIENFYQQLWHHFYSIMYICGLVLVKLRFLGNPSNPRQFAIEITQATRHESEPYLKRAQQLSCI